MSSTTTYAYGAQFTTLRPLEFLVHHDPIELPEHSERLSVRPWTAELVLAQGYASTMRTMEIGIGRLLQGGLAEHQHSPERLVVTDRGREAYANAPPDMVEQLRQEVPDPRETSEKVAKLERGPQPVVAEEEPETPDAGVEPDDEPHWDADLEGGADGAPVSSEPGQLPGEWTEQPAPGTVYDASVEGPELDYGRLAEELLVEVTHILGERRQLEAQRQTHAAHLAQIDELRRTAEAAERERDEARGAHQSALAELRAKIAEIAAARRERDDALTEMRAKTDHLARANTLIARLTAERDAAQERVQTLQDTPLSERLNRHGAGVREMERVMQSLPRG